MPVTRTCDLYGNPYPLGELEQLGRIPIREEPVLKIALAPAYVCPGCCEKKISELLAVVKPREAEARRALRERRDERDRERRAVQASLVFIDEERPPCISDREVATGGSAWINVTVLNGSGKPIYDAELRWHLGSEPYGNPDPELLGVIMPNDPISRRRVFPQDANLEVCGAVVTFRDAAGITWMRKPDGGLTEQP